MNFAAYRCDNGEEHETGNNSRNGAGQCRLHDTGGLPGSKTGVLIGSERLIAPYTDQRTVKAVTAAEILRAVENEDGEHFTVLMSGDTGFYSGTKKLVEQLNGKYAYRILPGISSVI